MPNMDRVDEEIRKILNEIIAHELKDPRLDTLINVTEVKTSKDLKTAKVFVSIMEKEKAKDALKSLNSASAYIRGLLFDQVKIRLVPHLTFYLDNSLENGYKIEGILKKMKENGELKEDVTDDE